MSLDCACNLGLLELIENMCVHTSPKSVVLSSLKENKTMWCLVAWFATKLDFLFHILSSHQYLWKQNRRERLQCFAGGLLSVWAKPRDSGRLFQMQSVEQLQPIFSPHVLVGQAFFFLGPFLQSLNLFEKGRQLIIQHFTGATWSVNILN